MAVDDFDSVDGTGMATKASTVYIVDAAAVAARRRRTEARLNLILGIVIVLGFKCDLTLCGLGGCICNVAFVMIISFRLRRSKMKDDGVTLHLLWEQKVNGHHSPPLRNSTYCTVLQ